MDVKDSIINRLKVSYYEKWKPEEYTYMVLEPHTQEIYFSNHLACDGNPYFCYKSFLTVIAKWEGN